jgi:MerR family transcriptional regulator/heat shock protein HspR
VRKYYLQLYSPGWDPSHLESHVLIDDLPFQPLLLERMAAIGIIEPKDRMLSQGEIERVDKILRLRHSLGVNLSGAAIIVELLDRLEAMEKEIERQKGA